MKLFKQRGLTLIELMIALLLGLILTGGAMQVFLSSKESYRLMESNSQLAQNGRLALEFMTNAITMAGFRKDLKTPYSSFFPQDSTFAQSEVIRGSDSAVSVRYYGYDDAFNRDCLGNAIAAGNYTTVTFSVNDSHQLVCQISGGTAHVMAENVDQLQIRYGLTSIGKLAADRYVTASEITNGTKWTDVVAVRIGLLVNSGIAANSSQNTRSYKLFGTTYPVSDSFLREAFTNTAGLWNVMQ